MRFPLEKKIGKAADKGADVLKKNKSEYEKER